MDRPTTRRTAIGMAAFIALFAGSASADEWSAPPAYYSGITATTSASLKSQLHNLIDSHRVVSYSSAITAFYLIDVDPSNANRIILIYNGASTPAQWDSGQTWNREHTWPRSRGVNSSGPDNSDLHMLRPCNSGINSSRSNKPFGDTSGSYWDPNARGGTDRGEIARAMFYGATRYEGDEPGTADLELVDGFPSGNNMGDLAALLRWHYQEMPETRERRRNHLIYSSALNPIRYQGNRNPFIDRPEYVWAIWGTSPNSSQIVIDGQTASAGATVVSLDAGFVLEGQSVGVPVTISKTGATPTTYEITTTGGAIVEAADGSATDIPRAFVPGTGSESFTVSLAGAGLGPASGTAVINNTDLTSAGSGLGSADGDDVVLLSATVVAPSAPSLDTASVVTSQTIDLGQVERLSGDVSVSRLVTNVALEAWQAAAFFEVGEITTPTPGVTVLWTGPAVADPGDVVPLTVTIDTAAPLGVVEATVVILASDDASVGGGQSRGDLTLVVRGELVQQTPRGDLNNDDAVDTADLLILLASFNSDDWDADATGDGFVDTADLLEVLSQFGTVAN